MMWAMELARVDVNLCDMLERIWYASVGNAFAAGRADEARENLKLISGGGQQEPPQSLH